MKMSKLVKRIAHRTGLPLEYTTPREGVGGTLWWGEAYGDGSGVCVEVTRNKYKLRLADIVVGDGDYDHDVRASLYVPGLTASVSLRRCMHGLRKRAYAWAKVQAERNKAAGRCATYAYQLDPMSGRHTKLSFHDGTVWVALWSNDMEWHCEDKHTWPWLTNGWEWNWSWYDAIFGDSDRQERNIRECTGWVVMPEGKYPAILKTWEVRWVRRFGVGRKWKHRAEVSVAEGIPYPGKGTTSYNCGDTATYALCFPVTDEPHLDWQYYKEYAMGIMKDRQRYGSLAYVPSDGWPAHCVRPRMAPTEARP